MISKSRTRNSEIHVHDDRCLYLIPSCSALSVLKDSKFDRKFYFPLQLESSVSSTFLRLVKEEYGSAPKHMYTLLDESVDYVQRQVRYRCRCSFYYSETCLERPLP